MNKIYKSFLKNKDWYLYGLYVFILTLIILNRNSIYQGLLAINIAFSPLFTGIVLAFIFNIPMRVIENFLKKHSKKPQNSKRGWAIFLTYILIFGILAIFFGLIIPQLILTISHLAQNANDLIYDIINNFDSVISFFHINFNIDISSTSALDASLANLGFDLDSVISTLQSLLNSFSSNIGSYLNSIRSGIYSIFLGLILAIYLLASKEKFLHQFKKVIVAITPVKVSNLLIENGRIVINIFASFVSGQLLEACIIGLLIYIIMLILSLPFAILISCIVTFLALIPIFGNIVAMILGAIIILAVNPIQSLYFIIAYQIVQQFENNVIYPRVVGSSVGLPPIFTLLAISIFGGLYGLNGMLIGVPVTASLYTLGAKLFNYLINKRNLVIKTDGYVTQKKLNKEIIEPEIKE